MAAKTDGAPVRINQSALTKMVAGESGMPEGVTADVLRALFDVVGREVAAGNTIFVTNFGTWTTRSLPVRQVRNPQTGERVTKGPNLVPKFIWAPAVRAAVKAGAVPKTFRKRSNRA